MKAGIWKTQAPSFHPDRFSLYQTLEKKKKMFDNVKTLVLSAIQRKWPERRPRTLWQRNKIKDWTQKGQNTLLFMNQSDHPYLIHSSLRTQHSVCSLRQGHYSQIHPALQQIPPTALLNFACDG